MDDTERARFNFEDMAKVMQRLSDDLHEIQPQAADRVSEALEQLYVAIRRIPRYRPTKQTGPHR